MKAQNIEGRCSHGSRLLVGKMWCLMDLITQGGTCVARLPWAKLSRPFRPFYRASGEAEFKGWRGEKIERGVRSWQVAGGTVARVGACFVFGLVPGAHAPWLLTVVPLALQTGLKMAWCLAMTFYGHFRFAGGGGW